MSVPDVGRRWTVDEVAEISDEAHSFELVDGQLIVSPVKPQWHQYLEARLLAWLIPLAPEAWTCIPEHWLPFSGDTLRRPDLALVRWPTEDTEAGSPEWLGPDSCGLVVEIVSPSSRRTDRFYKPAEYADAGIPLFWRLETDPALVLHAFRLEGKAYVPAATVTDSGEVPVPWGSAALDLADLRFSPRPGGPETG